MLALHEAEDDMEAALYAVHDSVSYTLPTEVENANKGGKMARLPKQRFDHSVLAGVSIVTRETVAEGRKKEPLFILTHSFLQ